MIFGPFLDVLPKAGLAGAVLWAGANYFVIAPNIAMRVARVDFVPACERNHEKVVVSSADDRKAQLTVPSVDPVRQAAARKLREIINSPYFPGGGTMGGPLGDLFDVSDIADATIGQVEQQAQAAKETYDRSLEQLKRETATSLANSGSVCGCVADAAIESTRTQWAIFTGTLTLFQPAPIQHFDQRMAEAYASGRCNGIVAPTTKVTP